MYLKARENWCVHFLPGWRIEGKLRVNEWKLFEKIQIGLKAEIFTPSVFFVLLYVNSNDLQKSAGKRFEMHKNGIRKRSRIEKKLKNTEKYWKNWKMARVAATAKKNLWLKNFVTLNFFSLLSSGSWPKGRLKHFNSMFWPFNWFHHEKFFIGRKLICGFLFFRQKFH